MKTSDLRPAKLFRVAVLVCMMTLLSSSWAMAEEKIEVKTPDESPEETKTESTRDEQVEDLPGGDRMPQVDFSTFIFSLFSSALIQLGEMEDPIN